MNRHKELFCSLRRSNSYMLTRYIYLKTFPGNTLQSHQKGNEKKAIVFLVLQDGNKEENVNSLLGSLGIVYGFCYKSKQKQIKPGTPKYPATQ